MWVRGSLLGNQVYTQCWFKNRTRSGSISATAAARLGSLTSFQRTRKEPAAARLFNNWARCSRHPKSSFVKSLAIVSDPEKLSVPACQGTEVARLVMDTKFAFFQRHQGGANGHARRVRKFTMVQQRSSFPDGTPFRDLEQRRMSYGPVANCCCRIAFNHSFRGRWLAFHA